MHQLDAHGLRAALEEAQIGYAEGGIPIGSALFQTLDVPDSRAVTASPLGRGHNMRVQRDSPTLHAEISALENAGRLKALAYKKCTLYTTLSPCSMCTGAILLYGIPRVVIGENANFRGSEDLLRSHGVEVIVQDDDTCKELMARFIREKPELWFEDIGEVPETDSV